MTFARDLASFADSASQNLTFRNKIINGDFGIWQRGTSFTNPTSSSTTYTTDRWILGFANANPTSASITQQSFTPGNPITGYEPTFFARSTITTVGSTTTYRPFTQRIEDVRTFAGQTVTLSFWAKADSARTLTTNFQQVFGTGGSSSVGGSGQSHTLSTSWNRYTHSFGVTSISGKTIGTSSYLEIIFQQAAASGSVLDIWGVQVEAGPAATPFEIRPIGTEFALCQRYYEKSFPYATAPQNGANSTSFATSNGLLGYVSGNSMQVGFLKFTVQKRVAPIMTAYGNSSGQTKYRDSVTSSTDLWSVSALTFTGISETGVLMQQNVVNNVVVPIQGHWVADAEL